MKSTVNAAIGLSIIKKNSFYIHTVYFSSVVCSWHYYIIVDKLWFKL